MSSTRSERDFRLLAETATDLITRSTPEGAVLYVSPSVRTLLGIAPEDYRGAATWEQVHPDDLPAILEARRQVLEDGLHRRVEFRTRHADGNVVWLESDIRAVRDEATGEIVEIHGSSRDVTQRNEQAQSERRAVERFEHSFTGAPVGMLLVRGRRIERANAAMAGLIGVTAEALVGRNPLEFVHADDQAAARESLGVVAAGQAPPPQERRIVGAGGTVLHMALRYSVLPEDEGGELPLVLLHFIDRTAEVRADEQRELAVRELSEAKAHLQAILDHSPMAIYMRDLEQRWIVVNPETCAIFGQPADELLGRSMAETHPPDVFDHFAAHDGEVLASGEPRSFDENAPDARTGDLRHFWSLKFPVRDTEGRVVALGGVSVDVTERDRATRELAAARELFTTMFASAPVGMLVSRLGDEGTEVIECNPAFARMLGCEPADLLGRIGLDIVHPDDLPERQRMLDAVLAGRQAAGELRLKHRDGHDVWALLAPAMVRGPDGERLIVLQAVDISESKRLEGELKHLADHDALTGLLGRRRFEEELDREVSRTRRHGRPGALLVLDLDGFKQVNDSLGHAAGDALLARVADAMRRSLRDSDVLARMGGDEFALILPDTAPAAARVVARKLIGAVRATGCMVSNGRRAAVTASVGLTSLGGSALDAGQLLGEADSAMYRAKGAGKDRVAVHVRSDAAA